MGPSEILSTVLYGAIWKKKFHARTIAIVTKRMATFIFLRNFCFVFRAFLAFFNISPTFGKIKKFVSNIFFLIWGLGKFLSGNFMGPSTILSPKKSHCPVPYSHKFWPVPKYDGPGPRASNAPKGPRASNPPPPKKKHIFSFLYYIYPALKVGYFSSKY